MNNAQEGRAAAYAGGMTHGPPAPARRRGRPRGGASDARERILAAGASEFAEHGYDGATMRAIAERAGVDSALVHHYFGTKSELFAAAVDIPANPARLVPQALEGDPADAGARLVRLIVTTWDSPTFRPRGVALLRGVIGNRRTSSMLMGFISREVLHRIRERIGGDDAPRRAGLLASQVIGLIVARYVVELEPLASASVDDVVRDVGPTLQRYLTGDLDEASPGA